MSTSSIPDAEKGSSIPGNISSSNLSDEEKASSSSTTPPPPEPTAPELNPWHPSQFPDGGIQAWLVVAGSFCLLFCSFGWINSIGFFQDYYQANQLKEYSASDISWIGSLELFMMLAGGIVVGRIYDTYGPRYLLIFGTFFHVFGLMMASISKSYYQIILSQGICSPIGISCLFTPATSATTSWFMKKRAFAIGIVVAGSSIGGVIFPIMLERLANEIGFGWAMRISAFLILALLIFGTLTVRSRIPPRPVQLKPTQYFKPLKELTFMTTTIASVVFYLVLFLPINYIQFQAVTEGMNRSLANYLIPILNAASLFGRVLPGYFADKIGRYNTNIIMCGYSGIIALALWLPAKGNAPLIVFAALYGFGSGAFVSLIPALIAQISDIREIGVRAGLEFAILSIPALVGNPIGGALITHDHGGFRDLQIFTGVCLMAGTVLFICARATLVGWKIWAKV